MKFPLCVSINLHTKLAFIEIGRDLQRSFNEARCIRGS